MAYVIGDNCLACGTCLDECPSGAISMVPHVYPVQQEKEDYVINVLNNLMRSKSKQENIASSIDGRLAKVKTL